MRTNKKTALITLSLLILLLAVTVIILDKTSVSNDELRGAVLILLDTVRADHLSCYGYGRETSPALSELAGKGSLFEKAVSFSPWTLPSVVNILSGCHPGPSSFEKRLKKSLVDSLQRAGFITAAFTEGGFVSRQLGMDMGFSFFIEEEGPVQLRSAGTELNTNPKGGIENTFRLAKDWLKGHRNDHFFLLIHTYEPHVPYTRNAFTKGIERGPFGEKFTSEDHIKIKKGTLSLNDDELQYIEALYDEGILEYDKQIGSFLAFLENTGLRDKTLVVVTSDHGEELGDHYLSFTGGHGHSLYDDLLLVPLIIHNPKESYAVKRVPFQIRLMDVMPTIIDILGGDDPQVVGQSLLPMLRGLENTGRTAYGGSTKVGPERIYLRHMGYKYIRAIKSKEPQSHPDLTSPPIRLYDLQSDPEELTNIAQENPDLVNKLQEILTDIKSPASTGEDILNTDEIDDALRKRLESLGYL